MRTPSQLRLLSALIALAVWGCEEKVAPRQVAEPMSAGPVATPTVPAHMREHFLKATELERAVIDGKLPEFKATAVWMAEHELSNSFPASWRPGVEAMKDAARLGRDAVSLKEAAASLGATGAACGACHQTLGGPKVTVGEPPAEGSGTAPHMLRHQWAVDMLWLGLVAPSDEAWVKGAEVMADAPLTQASISPKQTVTASIAQGAERAHALGASARTVDPAQRGQVFGELLLTCAGCHQSLAKM